MICFQCLDCRRFRVDCEGYIPELPGEDPYIELPCYEPEEGIEVPRYELIDDEEENEEEK